MQYLTLILSILPTLQALIKFAEQLHGAGNGAAKLNTVMTLLPSLVPEIETAFNVSPAIKNVVSQVVSIVVAIMNDSGLLQKTTATAATQSTAAPSSAVSIQPVPGSSFDS